MAVEMEEFRGLVYTLRTALSLSGEERRSET
jgi:hypothetical protein